MEGRYEMQYEVVSTTASCASLNIPEPPPEVELVRSGSHVRSTIQGLELSGTLYENGTFTLTGLGGADGGSDHLRLRATHLPPSSVTDGGTGLRGEWTGEHRRPTATASATCVMDRRFVGLRTR